MITKRNTATLRELVDMQPYTGETDMEIILKFLKSNECEEEAATLVFSLLRSKIDKLDCERRSVREWVSYLPSKYLYETYDLEIADRLHTLELDYLSNGNKLSKARLAWAKEYVPNIEMPKVYFQPLVEYLDSVGIRFKGSKK